MAQVSPVSANPRLLEWARQESGWPLERVAKRLQIKVERVEAWEKGERTPTLRQIEELARLFHRPLSVFFLSRPPRLAPLAAEYRRLPGIRPGHESPQLRLALRQMLARRENALNLYAELGMSTPPFSLSARLDENPAEVGARLRDALVVPVDDQLGWRSEWEAWRTWRSRVEESGVLVFQFGKVDLAEVRGLTLLPMPLPVVGVNGKEIPEAKSFTLLHEVVHLMLVSAEQEKSALQDHRPAAEWNRVEHFAEVAASHALIPEPVLKAEILHYFAGAKWTLDDTRRLAKKFRVTPLAAATRLRESGYLTWAQFRSWREQWDKYVATLPPRRGGFASPPEKAVNRAGRPFVQLVLEALNANRITSVDAARYLDLRYEHFGKLRDALSLTPAGEAMNE